MSDRISKGNYRVGISFNPSQHPGVNSLKEKAADFIDEVEAIKLPYNGKAGDYSSVERQVDMEVVRLKALAQTAAEEAAMWAVKAQTKHLTQLSKEEK